MRARHRQLPPTAALLLARAAQVENNVQALLATGDFSVSILGAPGSAEHHVEAAVAGVAWPLGKHLPALKVRRMGAAWGRMRAAWPSAAATSCRAAAPVHAGPSTRTHV